MRTIDIMAMPVQRLAGVKLLLESRLIFSLYEPVRSLRVQSIPRLELQRKSGRGQRALIQGAIDKVGDVLRYASIF